MIFPLFLFPVHSEEEQSDRMEESLGGEENSDKHEKSVSEGHQVEDAGSSSNEMEESKEEDPESVEQDIKNAAGTSNTAKGSDEDVSCSEETQKRALSREDSDDVANEVGKSHLQVNQADDADGYPPSSHESDRTTSAASEPEEAENSDDEPLVLFFCLFQLHSLFICMHAFITLKIYSYQMQGVWKRRAGKLVEGK